MFNQPILKPILQDLESYLKSRAPVTFLSDLRSSLQVSNEPGMRYNIPLINALVLYVGTQAISHIHSKNQTPSMSTIAHSSHMDIFQVCANKYLSACAQSGVQPGCSCKPVWRSGHYSLTCSTKNIVAPLFINISRQMRYLFVENYTS